MLVTDAPPSRLDDVRARQRRYLWTMGIRVVCFVLAVTLLHGIAAAVAAAGAIVLPWVAVVAANAGPKRHLEQPQRYRADPPPALEPPRVHDLDG